MVLCQLGHNSMSWKPKTKNATIIFDDGNAKGLEITFKKTSLLSNIFLSLLINLNSSLSFPIFQYE